VEKANIDRINELTRLSRERELTVAEKEERAKLRAAYLKAFRANFVQQLDSVVVEYPDHHREKLKKKR
jgi:uncharacterized protein YnzC (UPF0291/DUF896 family)